MKIGSGNYFWSFPSKYSQQRKRKLEELEKKYSMLQKRTDESLTEIEKQKNLRVETVRAMFECNRGSQSKTCVIGGARRESQALGRYARAGEGTARDIAAFLG